jgi:hypothetical protein
MVLGIGLSVTSTTAFAAGSSPYQGIVDRNVFGLKPPVSANVEEAPPPAPPLKITLTGITTILGNKRALMSVAIPNKQPESYILTEGQRQGEIEVLQINEKAGTVKVKNHGIEQTLDFKTDGAKANPVPAVANVTPGVIPQPNAPAGPGNQPGVGTLQTPAPPRTIPRMMRIATPEAAPPAPGGE